MRRTTAPEWVVVVSDPNLLVYEVSSFPSNGDLAIVLNRGAASLIRRAVQLPLEWDKREEEVDV